MRNFFGNIAAPFEETGEKYRNVFTGEIVSVAPYNGAKVLFLSQIFMNFPAALMEKIT